MRKNLKTWAGIIAVILVALFAGVGVTISINNSEPKVEIKYSDTEVPAIIELDDQKEVVEAPTVEAVDAEVVTPKDSECPEESEECAKGAYLPAIDISTPSTFYNSVINQCIDFDGAYGSQCYDLMAYFHYVYTGRWLSTAGTGAAYGIWDARDYNNQGNEYILTAGTGGVRPGAFGIWHNGIYGHVALILSYPHDGYVTVLGTNQGGPACPGGGAAANVINISLNTLSGTFMPRIWAQPEPQPEPTPEPSTTGYVYQKGDYFSAVVEKLGLTTENGLWGENGDVNYYNKQLHEAGILNYYNGRYWNNIPVGTIIELEAR